MPTVLHSIVVGGIDYSQDAIVMCGRPKTAYSVAEGWSHDEGRGGRSVTEVQRGDKTKVHLGLWKCNEWAENFMHGGWEGGMASRFLTMYCMAFKHGFTVYYSVFLAII